MKSINWKLKLTDAGRLYWESSQLKSDLLLLLDKLATS